MKRRQRGAITVFLSIILIAAMALESVFVEAVHITIAKAQAEKAMDDAVYSAMSEYEKQLFEMYGIFGVDGQPQGLESLLSAVQLFLDDSLQTVDELNNQYRPLCFASPEVALSASLPLSDPNVLCNQAISQMKIQGPWQMVHALGNVVGIDFDISIGSLSLTEISGAILSIVNSLIDVSEKAKENCEVIKDSAEISEATNKLYSKTLGTLNGSCAQSVRDLSVQLAKLKNQYLDNLTLADSLEFAADSVPDDSEEGSPPTDSDSLREEAEELRESAADDFILGISQLFETVETSEFETLKKALNDQIFVLQAKIQQTGNADSSGSMGAALDASVMSLKKDVQKLKALLGVMETWSLAIEQYVPNGSGNETLSVGSGKIALPDVEMIQVVRDGGDPSETSEWDDLDQTIQEMIDVADVLPSLNLDSVENDWDGAGLEKPSLLEGNAERVQKLTFQHSLSEKKAAGWMDGASIINADAEAATLMDYLRAGALSVAGRLPGIGMIIQIINAISSFINLLKAFREGLLLENLYITEYILSNFTNAVQAFSQDGAILTILGLFGSDDLLKIATPLVDNLTDIKDAMLPGTKDDVLAYRLQENGKPNSTTTYATDEIEYILCSAGLWTDDLLDPGGSLGKRLLSQKDQIDPLVGNPLYDISRVATSLFVVKFLLNLVQGFVDPVMMGQSAASGLGIGTPATLVLFMLAETVIDMILMMGENQRVPLWKIGNFYMSLDNVPGMIASSIIGGVTETIKVACKQFKKEEDDSLKLIQSIIYDFNTCIDGNYTLSNIEQAATILRNRYGPDLVTPIATIENAYILFISNGQYVSDNLLAYTYARDFANEYLNSAIWDGVFALSKDALKDALKEAIKNSLNSSMNLADPNGSNAGNNSQQNPGSGGQQNPGSGGQSNPGSGGQSNPGSGGQANSGNGGQANSGNGGQANSGSGGQANPGNGVDLNKDPGNGVDLSKNPGNGVDLSKNPGNGVDLEKKPESDIDLEKKPENSNESEKKSESGNKGFSFKPSISINVTMSYVDFLRVSLWVSLINNRDAVLKAMQEVMQVNIKYYLEQHGQDPNSFALKDRYACLSGKADLKLDFAFMGQAFLPSSVRQDGKYNFSVWSSRTY